jgi:hypothetical protein
MLMVIGVLKMNNGVVVVVVNQYQNQNQLQNAQFVLLLKVTNAAHLVVPFTTPMMMVNGVLKTTIGVVCQLTAKKHLKIK